MAMVVKRQPENYDFYTIMQNFFSKRFHFLAILALLAFLVGQLLGKIHWFAELFSHFVPHYALLFALATIWARGKIWRGLWSICLIICLIFLFTPSSHHHNAANSWRMIWYNVNLNNDDPLSETEQILAYQPQIVALAEIDLDDARWQKLHDALPHGCEYQSDSPFALAVWSKQTWQSCEVQFIGDYPYIRAEQAGRVVYALHPPPPINRELAQSRAQYLAEIAPKIARENKVLVVGDLNASPFSPVFRQFVRSANIAPQTPNWWLTWRTFGLNIDHVLARETVQVQTMKWGQSDHRGLWVE
ncbi:endonuclease/exonuclease/phosphatase family protein [Wielerella bovis]|uniref:endonuclease/exonuclease/phosphatase family protein n=1 Tax=Wielerella bovis TaxID=2917790 RepID=UPI00201A0053|nr:endonuclease/exonuclease/phosphatase family protein [Wielerella bovis]ULJ61730.1 endonuclease/exonuclease/phosphatase family protein [Wielerella bovis]